jgi:hypothetical protein
MNISFEQFMRMWDKHCERVFGIDASSLPDILCIDDYWYEDMSQQEAKDALLDMEQELREELHFDA